VLSREKFAVRLAQAGLTPPGIVGEIRRLTLMVRPASVPRVAAGDADDDHVLACALAGSADLIVSGDKHLPGISEHRGVRIVTPAMAVPLIGGQPRRAQAGSARPGMSDSSSESAFSTRPVSGRLA
jgi:hypothetical protein